MSLFGHGEPSVATRIASVSHEGRDSHRLENRIRDAAKQYFPETRVAIAAHHHQIRAEVGRIRQQGIPYIHPARRLFLRDLDADSVARKIVHNIRFGSFVMEL
jgi:hypothetical protein